MKPISGRLAGTGTTVFSEMTALAVEHKAINLGQGFPDFPGPAWLKEAAGEAINADLNQYAPSAGVPELREALAAHLGERLGGRIDADREIVVTTGATEGIMATVLALVDPGNEVIVFEPFYDSYVQAVRFAGATPRFVPMYPPDESHESWWYDREELTQAFTPQTKLLMLNTPTNPTGKCFTREELEEIAQLCKEYDTYVLSDEVYEFMVYDDRAHRSIASLPGMWERTVTISSAGKSFSVTGWKVGWCVGPEELVQAVKLTHQFTVFCSATPLQHAVARALHQAEERGYYRELRFLYESKRDRLWNALEEVGLRPYRCEGTYFILCDVSHLGFRDDVEFCRHLTTEAQVTAIPPSFFYSEEHAHLGRRMVRFSFCKRDETLDAAASNLGNWASRR